MGVLQHSDGLHHVHARQPPRGEAWHAATNLAENDAPLPEDDELSAPRPNRLTKHEDLLHAHPEATRGRPASNCKWWGVPVFRLWRSRRAGNDGLTDQTLTRPRAFRCERQRGTTAAATNEYSAGARCSRRDAVWF
jgi:hypothetical protein